MQAGKNVKTFNIDPASNRLLSITAGKQIDKKYQYDAMGNQVSDGYTALTYDDRAKLVKASNMAFIERYFVNGFSQRMTKLRGAERKDRDDDKKVEKEKEREAQPGTYFMYDEAGHLIGEYNQEGKASQETVWLGDMPMAVLTENRHYFIYVDHLNAPRAIANQEGKVVWRWDSDPFGNVIGESERDREGISVNKGVDEDHDRDGNSFAFNLRFPGQYYDKSTGLNYNVNRYYNPKTGRYTQSDPIGLGGGLNTYGYVNSNPLLFIDIFGLTRVDVEIANWLAASTQTDLKYPEQIMVIDLSEYGDDVVGVTRPGVSIRIDDRYDQVLSDYQANDLLDTVIHESIHYTYPKDDLEHQVDFSGGGFPYEEALRRTTTQLKKEFNILRKMNPKDRNKELERFLKCKKK